MIKIFASILQDKGARLIMSALEVAGEARFIGGCVRDAVLGQPSVDVDLATTLLPEKVLDLLRAAGLTARPLGAAHGVVLAWHNKQRYEIATLREDVATDGRHALVAYTQDWAIDARRRDFTINALSADLNGQVYDYIGGLEDLYAHQVQFIGEPTARIREDYLRILRYYRFHTRFGHDWNISARAACRENRAGLSQLSRERVTEELRKLLSLGNPMPGCKAISEDEILADIIPKLRDIPALEKLLEREKVYGPQSWLVRLAAWGGQAKTFTEDFLDQFVFTRTDRADVKTSAILDFQVLNHAVYHYGAPAVRAAVMLRAADQELPEFMQQIDNFKIQEFPLRAESLLQMGVKPGPHLGEILRQTENWWLETNGLAGEAECRNYAAALATVSSA